MKAAILNTLGLLIGKGGVALKPFVPQLQTTFLKCLADQVDTVAIPSMHVLTCQGFNSWSRTVQRACITLSDMHILLHDDEGVIVRQGACLVSLLCCGCMHASLSYIRLLHIVYRPSKSVHVLISVACPAKCAALASEPLTCLIMVCTISAAP